MNLGFGLLSGQLRPGETDWSPVYRDNLALAVEAERLGYSSVWTTEHHFVDDGYMPSLMVMSGAIAAVTSTIEVGTGVLLAPLHHPLRLAEDAATVGLLSGGRLALGLGLGWSAVEYGAMGAEMRRRGKAMDEILTILPQAWSGEPFHHQGEVYSYPELAVRPIPSAKIPVLIGGGAEAAIRRAARKADGLFANVPFDRFRQQIDWLLDECGSVGRDPAEMRIVHYSVMLPARSEADAWDRYTEHLWQMMWKYRDMEGSAHRPGPPPAAPAMTDDDRAQLMARSTVAGTSEQIVEKLTGLRESLPIDVEFVARSHFPTLEQAAQLELMQQLAEEVAPHL